MTNEELLDNLKAFKKSDYDLLAVELPASTPVDQVHEICERFREVSGMTVIPFFTENYLFTKDNEGIIKAQQDQISKLSRTIQILEHKCKWLERDLQYLQDNLGEKK